MQLQNVLIVDDEKAFLNILSEEKSAWAGEYNIFTAENGRVATEILQAKQIDLVVTDLKMPVMDGYELLAFLSSSFPDIPTVVMTAFGTPEIEEKIETLGAVQYLEKPINLQQLADKIQNGLQGVRQGYLKGITLPSFLQVLEAERKTCTLTVKTGKLTGKLFLSKGTLVESETGESHGEEAALMILAWDNAEIEIKNICRPKSHSIETPLQHLLMEAFRVRDENQQRMIEAQSASASAATEVNNPKNVNSQPDGINPQQEEISMTTKEKLQELASLDGFVGVGLFTPNGESLALLAASGDTAKLKDVGVLANNVLLNAQKASIDMGTGRGQLVHVEAENAHFLVRCLNEGTDPLKSQPGKSHIHLVLVLSDDSSIGMAKMKIAKIIGELAGEFRV